MENANTDTYTVGHLFAGIDGFGLGLDAVGAYRTVFTAEWADFPHRILTERVSGDVEHFRDVRELTDPPAVDVLTGGFPCQDLSLAGKGAGIHGARSGLWSEYARIIEAARPRVVLIENVPALLRRGFEIVVDNLVELGYSVEWDCLPAAAFGAPHLRDRVFAVAHRAPTPSVYGESIPALFAESWRDLPTREDGWQTWPRAGFVSGDELVELEPLAPLAEVRNEGARVVDFPTPMARDYKDVGVGRYGRGSLPEAVRNGRELWPTPQAADNDRRAPDLRRAERVGTGDDLTTAVMRRPLIVPTPNARDGEHNGGPVENRLAGGHSVNLTDYVYEDGARPAGPRGQLNPDWVEWLMGFPIGWTNPAVAADELVAWPWHEGEPPGLPRTTTDRALRRERLTALGNALVPPAAAWLGARVLALLEADR